MVMSLTSRSLFAAIRISLCTGIFQPRFRDANDFAEDICRMTAPTFEKLIAPKHGSRVTVDAQGRWDIPDDPIVCLMRGDGIGRDVGNAPGITTCAARVLDAAVERAYKGKRRIHWFDVHAGDVARQLYYPQVKDEQVNS